MFFIEPKIAVSLAKVAVEHRQLLIRSLKRLQLWIKRGTLHIVIFGPGGAGKSTLGLFLSGKLDLSVPTKYVESIDLETHKLGDLVGQLIVAPGQGRRRNIHWPNLFQEIEGGASIAVINVVAFGYHSFDKLSYKEFPFYKPNMTPQQFLDEYRIDRLKEELNVANTLLPRLLDAKSKIWMLTVVTKQDLWWNDRHNVEAHYTQGPYDAIIQEIYKQRGQQNFVHEYLSVAPVVSNFTSGTGELLASNTGGYDQSLQSANLNELLKTFEVFARRK